MRFYVAVMLLGVAVTFWLYAQGEEAFVFVALGVAGVGCLALGIVEDAMEEQQDRSEDVIQ